MGLPGLLAIIGGFGLGISLFLPYFQVFFLVTFQLNAFDLGLLVWGPLALAAVLSVIAGIQLGSKFDKTFPRACLAISTLAIIIAGLIIVAQIDYYYTMVGQELGTYVPLNYGLGLIAGFISAVLVMIATVMVFSGRTGQDILSRYYKTSPGQERPRSRGSYTQGMHQHLRDNQAIETEAYCPNCGEKTRINLNYCIHCGNSLGKYREQWKRDPSSRGFQSPVYEERVTIPLPPKGIEPVSHEDLNRFWYCPQCRSRLQSNPSRVAQTPYFTLSRDNLLRSLDNAVAMKKIPYEAAGQTRSLAEYIFAHSNFYNVELVSVICPACRRTFSAPRM